MSRGQCFSPYPTLVFLLDIAPCFIYPEQTIHKVLLHIYCSLHLQLQRTSFAPLFFVNKAHELARVIWDLGPPGPRCIPGFMFCAVLPGLQHAQVIRVLLIRFALPSETYSQIHLAEVCGGDCFNHFLFPSFRSFLFFFFHSFCLQSFTLDFFFFNLQSAGSVNVHLKKKERLKGAIEWGLGESKREGTFDFQLRLSDACHASFHTSAHAGNLHPPASLCLFVTFVFSPVPGRRLIHGAFSEALAP